MKNVCAIVVIIVMLSSMIVEARTLRISGDQVNVRSGPGRTYDVIEVVDKNEQFEILEEQEGWYKISVEGTLGWVSEQAVLIAADEDVQKLLTQADIYFARQQFTTPPEANAFDLYQQVLRQDAGNAHARNKIDQMAHIYKTWAERAYQQGDSRKAKIFYQRYLFIVPEDQAVQKFLAQSENPVLNPAAILKIVRLRAEPATLSAEKMVQMIQTAGFHHPADWSKYQLSPSIIGNIQHEYTKHRFQAVEVVVDYTTNLMWQQSGTAETMTWPQAHDYIHKLNREGYGGFADWRLPTIAELASLLEPTREHGDLYLSPVFGADQLWCWSADKMASADNAAWYVSFSSGGVQYQEIRNLAFVLAVRTLETPEK